MRSRFGFAGTAVLLMSACAGGDAGRVDSASTRLAPAADSPSAGAASASPSDTGTAIHVIPGTIAPITGAIIEVKMIGDAKGFRFEPQHISARIGDGVKFVVISGGPHEIAFDLAQVPADSRSQLQVNMPNSANGKSPLLSGSQETWTLSLAGLTPGRYPFVSTPRLPQGMKGDIELR